MVRVKRTGGGRITLRARESSKSSRRPQRPVGARPSAKLRSWRAHTRDYDRTAQTRLCEVSIWMSSRRTFAMSDRFAGRHAIREHHRAGRTAEQQNGARPARSRRWRLPTRPDLAPDDEQLGPSDDLSSILIRLHAARASPAMVGCSVRENAVVGAGPAGWQPPSPRRERAAARVLLLSSAPGSVVLSDGVPTAIDALIAKVRRLDIQILTRTVAFGAVRRIISVCARQDRKFRRWPGLPAAGGHESVFGRSGLAALIAAAACV